MVTSGVPRSGRGGNLGCQLGAAVARPQTALGCCRAWRDCHGGAQGQGQGA